MLKTVRVAAICALALATVVAGATSSDDSFVVIGSSAHQTDLVAPVLLEQSADSIAAIEAEILTPQSIVNENKLIADNQATLASMELIAHRLGAPVYSELLAEKADHDVAHIERSLMEHPAASTVELLTSQEHVDLPAGATSLLETAPVAQADESADFSDLERELNMVELASEVAPKKISRAALQKAHDYAFMDDPQHGGQPTVLKNLQGLDIYVVNTPVVDNDNEIRPVQPPHPMSAANRKRAHLAALMRKQLIHDIPQPKAAVKPKTPINTLSAYESSLVPSKAIHPISRLRSRTFNHPLVGGQGAMQLMGASLEKPKTSTPSEARFAQLHLDLPGTGDLPVFPKDPNAKPEVIRAFGAGSSFDNRDGPPVLLDGILPIKADLVESLNPL